MMSHRFRAFSIHLLASLIVVGTTATAMYLAWYPAPLAKLQGWLDVLWILIGVDIVLGPCLTFVVYSPQKKGLRFDLTAIVLVQLAALAYGSYTSAIGRPVYLVFLKDRFEVVTAAEYPAEELAAAKNSTFLNFSWLGPKTVTATMPREREEARVVLFSALAGEGLKVMPRYYQPYNEAAQAAAASGITLARVQQIKPLQAKELLDWTKAKKRKPDTVTFVPLNGRLGYGLVMLDARSGDIVSMKAIDPSWY